MSFLWEGIEPPKPQAQRMEGQLQQPGGGQPLDISQTFEPLPAPAGYRQSAFTGKRELENQAYANAEAKAQRDMQSQMAQYRGKKQIDQEFETIAPPNPRNS